MNKTNLNFKQWHTVIIVLLVLVLSFFSWLNFAKTIGGGVIKHFHVGQDTQYNNTQTIDEDVDSDAATIDEHGNTLAIVTNLFDYVISKVDSIWSIYKQAYFIKVDSMLTYYTTGEILSVQVLKGEDGWLFYRSTSDGNPIADFEGTNRYTKSEMEEIANSALLVQDKVESMNCKFAILVAPNKENIYYEHMPNTYKHAEQSSTDLLIEYLINQGVNIVSPKAALLAIHNNQQLYYSYDTHWNQLGAYIGVKETLAEWGFILPDLSERNIISTPLNENYHYCGEDDLAKMVGLLSVLSDEVEYTVDGTVLMEWEIFQNEQNKNIVSHFQNNSALNKQKLLLVGDSFRSSMVPALREQFSDVYVVHRSYFTSSVIDEIMPDYVIVEYVERKSGEINNIDILFK